MTEAEVRAEPKAFEEAVREYLRPLEGNFAHATMLGGHLDAEKYRPWVREIAGYRAVAGSDVLSSGCGSAAELQVFMEEGAARCCGVEVSPGLVSLAQRRFEGTPFQDRVDIRHYDGTTLPFPDHAFDIAVSIHVIEHVGGVGPYLAELFRTLRPGGILYLDFPNRLFSKEQHTSLRGIHYVPHALRDALIRLATGTPARRFWSDATCDKLKALRGMRPPYASQVVRACRALRDAHRLEVADAYYHSYTDVRIPYGRKAFQSFLTVVRRLTTVRMVVRKQEP